MLPILRMIPVGGVLLAIAILVLALNPPAGPHVHLTAALAPPRGALIARDEHPEWRQFLILAALRRADELNKLRDLPDTPTRTAPLVRDKITKPAKSETAKTPEATKLAGVQPGRANEDDITGTVQSPADTMPVDIGEASSTELPIIPHEEQPPVIMMPASETPQPENSIAPPPVQPKPEKGTAAPESVKSKHASREVTPLPAGPKQSAPQPTQPNEEIKATEPKPALSKQANRDVPPLPAEAKQATPQPAQPNNEIKAMEPKPALSKLASREVPLPLAKPNFEVQHTIGKLAKPRRRVRLARRIHHATKKKQEVVQFDLFRILFGFAAGEPAALYSRPSAVH